MLDKTKRYLVVGLGLLGGKYALELTKAGFHVDGINRSEGHLQYALDHGYIASGKTHDFEDLVQQADHHIRCVAKDAADFCTGPTDVSVLILTTQQIADRSEWCRISEGCVYLYEKEYCI